MTRLVGPCLIVGATLMATICWEAGSLLPGGTSETRNSPAPSVIASVNPPPSRPADPVEAWATTSLERPLLRESRRPDKVADPQGKAEAGPRLAGVVTGPFGDHAIFMMPGAAKAVIVTVGAHLADFVVRSIEPGRVVVVANGVLHNYRPLFDGKTASLAATPKRSS